MLEVFVAIWLLSKLPVSNVDEATAIILLCADIIFINET